MSDLAKRIERLQAKALSKSAVEKKALHDQRQKTWKKIQEQAPDVAELMLAVNDVFGKPAAVAVKIGSEVVLNSGLLAK